MRFPPQLWNRMSTNLPKTPIPTVENSIVSGEKVPKSIITAEKGLLLGNIRCNCGKFHCNCRKNQDSQHAQLVSDDWPSGSHCRPTHYCHTAVAYWSERKLFWSPPTQ